MALILSVIGLVRRQSRPAAVVGIVLSGLTMALLFGYPVLMSLCK